MKEELKEIIKKLSDNKQIVYEIIEDENFQKHLKFECSCQHKTIYRDIPSHEYLFLCDYCLKLWKYVPGEFVLYLNNL